MWLERNRRTFEDVSHFMFWLQSRLLMVLYSWFEHNVDPDMFSFLAFLEDVIGYGLVFSFRLSVFVASS